MIEPRKPLRRNRVRPAIATTSHALVKISFLFLAVIATYAGIAFAQPAPALPPGKEILSPNWVQANIPDDFDLVSVGDLIITEPVSPLMKRLSPDLIKLLKSGDVTMGNYEGTAADLRQFGGYPAALSGGGWLLSSAKVPNDLKAMGFDMVGRANNHATDWGVAGMRSTDRLLDEAGIVHAGTGETLAEARAPRILTTSAGRISLVSTASRFEPDSRAIDPLGEVPGRPGLNALRTTRFALVAPEQLEQLAKIRDSQPKGSVRNSVFASDARTGTVTLFGTKYRANKRNTDQIEFSFEMDERDRSAIIRNVRQGKQTSDFSIVSMHVHEPGNYSNEPPDFMKKFAHETIDNGADAIVGHGPHQLRGIEIYKGKPIFYSLGNFFFMDNTWQPITRDEYEVARVEPGTMTDAEFTEKLRVEGVFKDSIWFESVIASSRYDKLGRIKEIRLHPIELHWNDGRDADRGIPRIAPPAVASRILNHLRKLSEPLGTKIEIENNIGIIRNTR